MNYTAVFIRDAIKFDHAIYASRPFSQ